MYSKHGATVFQTLSLTIHLTLTLDHYVKFPGAFTRHERILEFCIRVRRVASSSASAFAKASKTASASALPASMIMLKSTGPQGQP